jgi:protein phosphatase 1 regulatory subunit 37
MVRTSSLKNLSLRHNRINVTGAVAVALMIRDYPDIVPGLTPSNSNPSTPPMSPAPVTVPLAQSPSVAHSPLPLPPPTRSGPLPPPPKHPTATPQTTYTPYIPRSKRGIAQQQQAAPLSPAAQQVPIITSSAQGGITTRHAVPQSPAAPSTGNGSVLDGPSAALLDKVRALDNLPRLGSLRTLDLRGNDLRVCFRFCTILNFT